MRERMMMMMMRDAAVGGEAVFFRGVCDPHSQMVQQTHITLNKQTTFPLSRSWSAVEN